MAATKKTTTPRKAAAPKTTTAKTAAPKAAAAKTTTAKTAAPKAPAAAKPVTPKTTTAKTTAPKTTAAKSAPRKPAAKSAPAPAVASPGTASRAISIASIGALAVAAGAAIWQAVRRLRGPGNAEHKAPDLALDQARPGPDDRAPDAFRPDPTAPVPASEREGLRPATVPAREVELIN